MYWNHRVIEHNTVENYEAIHEVYYNEVGEIQGWTEEPVAILKYEDDTWENILAWVVEATQKPVLVEVMGEDGKWKLVERK